MEVVGYSYDADIHCPECTFDYAREVPYSEFLWDDRDEDDYRDIHGHLRLDKMIEDEIIRDGENNPIHAIFDTDESGDTPDHCGDCGAYINTSWIDTTVGYAVDALADYVLTERGNTEVLDTWANELSSGMVTANVDEVVVEAYRNARKAIEARDSSDV